MATEAIETALSACVSKYLIPAQPGPTLNRVIQVTLDKERYAADMAPAVIDNTAYAQFVLKLDILQSRVKEWIAEMPEGQVNVRVLLERIFILLGKQASRNLVASIRLARIANTLPKKKSDRFSVNPKEQLKHGLTCEEFCENRNYAGGDLAFLAGLQFDLLYTAFTKAKASREAMSAFQTHFPESLRIAHFAYEIGSRMGAFPHSEYAFSAALSLGLGKILAYPLYPKESGAKSYATFLTEVEKKTVLKWPYATSEERQRFPVMTDELSAIAVGMLDLLAPIEPAIRFSREAYFLKKSQPRLHPLALLLGLAESSALGKPISAADLQDLKALRVNPTILSEATKAVQASKGR
jgi:hypothetical protein